MTVWRLLCNVQHSGFVAAAWCFVMLASSRAGFAQTPPTEPPPIEQPPAGQPPPADPDARARGLLPEPAGLRRAMAKIAERADSTEPKHDGLYPAIGVSMPGAGLAGGPGYRHHLGRSPWLFDTSAAVSWRTYTQVQAGLSGAWFNGALTIGGRALWQDQTQASYFGSGPSSNLSDRSAYRIRAVDYSLSAIVRSGGGWTVRMGGGLLDHVNVLSPSGWHDPEHPDTALVFTPETAPGLDVQPRFWHADVSVSIDRLDFPRHPRRGWLLRTGMATYRDRDLDRFSFTRYEATGVQAVPLSRDMWTLVMREAFVMTDTRAGQVVPFYMEPSLGSHNALRGYLDYRFHDQDAAAIDIESRWAIFAHMDAAVFADFGEVAPQPHLFRRSTIRESYGAGVRLHTGKSTVVRVDVGMSREGWRFLFVFSDPFQLSVFRRRAEVVPIAP